MRLCVLVFLLDFNRSCERLCVWRLVYVFLVVCMFKDVSSSRMVVTHPDTGAREYSATIKHNSNAGDLRTVSLADHF